MLILTEKPSVAKDFASALGCSFSGGTYRNSHLEITNCVGHLFSLEEPSHYGSDIPIIPERFDYKVNPNVEKQANLVISKLKSHKSDTILIATDADREGEVIARECLSQAGITDFSRIKRFWVSQALTKDVILEGIKNAKPLSEYNLLSEKGFARQKADWLVGMNLSRYITKSSGAKLAVGRVQTAVLSAIGQRCSAIRNFKSEKYFEHYGVFRPSRDGSSGIFRGIYFVDETTAFPDNTHEAKLKPLSGKNARLIDNKTESKTANPPQLYNLNAAQKDAFKAFGYSAETTLKIIQSLYEDLKCVSYPRTPSRVMGSANVELCLKIADELSDFYPKFEEARKIMRISVDNKLCFNDAKLEAHHALIPLKSLPENASDEQKKIYSLILDRFFTAFLPPEKYEKQTFILDVEGNNFKVTGRKVIEQGWKAFQDDRHVSVQNDEDKDGGQILGGIDWSQVVLSETETKEKWTKPPAFFNEASILAFMENPKADSLVTAQDKITTKKLAGLGTPATRHTFIPKLTKWGYITLEKKNLVSTSLGENLLKAVRGSPIKSLADIAETTSWEEQLDENPEKFLSDIKSFVKESVSKEVEINIPHEAKNSIICPFCKMEMRRGKSNWYCSGYKEGCGFVVWDSVAGAKISEKDVVMLCSGKGTGIKHCKSKAGKSFDCRFKVNLETAKIDFLFER